MPRTNQNYEVRSKEEVYDVTTQITELRMPAIKGFTDAEVAFGDEASALYSLGKVSVIDGPFIPVSGSDPLLKVVSQVNGSSEPAVTEYLFYTLSGNNYNLFSSPNADGSDSAQIGTVPTTSTDPSKTTMKLEYVATPGKPVIVIGDIVIDPPVKG